MFGRIDDCTIYTVRLRLDGTFCSVVCSSSSGEKRKQMSKNVKGVFGLKLES